MRIFLPLLSLLLLAPTLRAQTGAPAVLCGNEVFDQMLAQHYPGFKAGLDATFDATRRQSAQAAADRGGAPLTVNVVVHVVWKDPAENLPDSVILDQLAVLNADFNRQNADTANLRALFAPAAGNPQIQFNLVGIERVQTNVEFQVSLLGTNLLPELKSSAQGGSDAWDTEHYLNIWVCKIQPIGFGPITLGQILGFAFPPAGLANWPAGSNAPEPGQDGVVIDFRVFGSNNPNTIANPNGGGNLTVQGRTAVHEVGHYLGLRHIWGDGGVLGLPNDCDQSDGIDDTPFASAQSAFDCNTDQNSCSKVEIHYGQDMPDLVENFMDYSSETCQNMFTQGQAAHMVATLNGPRIGLLEPFVATHERPRAAAWSLAPNPAADRTVVTLHTPGALELRVVDAAGQVRMQVLNPGMRVEVPTGEWENGVYFVQMRDEKGVATKKLMVLR